MEFTIFTLTMICCIFAVIEITRAIMQYVLMAKKRTNTITVMPINGKIDDIEYIVRHLMWKNSWGDDYTTQKIIILDLGADEETVSICKCLCEENQMIKFCTPKELEEYLKK